MSKSTESDLLSPSSMPTIGGSRGVYIMGAVG